VTDIAAPLEHRIRTYDGVELLVRPIRPDDVELERRFINGLSEESRYQRLMYSLREPSAGFVRQMVTIDFQRTMAFVAVDARDAEPRFVAVARYACEKHATEAEFAIVVADAWQGRGVGTQLARLLFDFAAARGLTALYGTVLTNNTRMLKLVDDLGMSVTPSPGDPSVVVATRLLAAPPTGHATIR
jgi:acetyltransferase